MDQQYLEENWDFQANWTKENSSGHLHFLSGSNPEIIKAREILAATKSKVIFHEESTRAIMRATFFGAEILSLVGDIIPDIIDTLISEFVEADTTSQKCLVSTHPLRIKIPEDIKCVVFPLATFAGYIQRDRIPSQDIIYKFSFLVNRLDYYRLCVFYHLLNDEIVSDGAVAFAGRNAMNRNDTNLDLDELKRLNAIFFDTDNFEDAVKKSYSLLPYKNFEEPNRADAQIYCWMLGKVFMVHETYPQSDVFRSVFFFSEKTILALQTPRPFVLLACEGSVSKLRELGFKVFDDYVKHDAYDNEYLTVVRNDKAYREFKRVIDELEPTDFDINLWHEYAEHNRQLLMSKLGPNMQKEKTAIFMKLIEQSDPESYETIVSACKQQQDML